MCRHRVSGSLSSPPGSTFHLSFTVLCYRSLKFSLAGGPRSFRQGFSPCLVLLWILLGDRISDAGFFTLSAGLPSPFLLSYVCHNAVRPAMHASRFGLFPFRSPLLWEIDKFSFFLRVLDVSVPRFPGFTSYYSLHADRVSSAGFPPFRYLRIIVDVLLPEAFQLITSFIGS